MYSDPSGNKEIPMLRDGVIVGVNESKYKNWINTGWTKYTGQTLNYTNIIVSDASVDTVNVGRYASTVDVHEDSNIKYLNTAKKSTLTINNSGNIWQISTGDRSYTTVYNNGNIDMYCAGVNSHSYITNYENIKQINTRMKSELYIANTGNIGSIYNGKKSKCYIDNSKKGNIGKVVGGHVEKLNIVEAFIRRLNNGVTFNMESWSRALERNPSGYLTEQISNLYTLCKMSTLDITMKTGESIDAWYQRFMSADKYKKTDMAADLIAEGIRIEGANVAISKLGKVLTGGKIEGASKAEGGLSSIKNLDGILLNPSKLSGMSGDELYFYLVKNGYDVKPLSKGSFKGIPFGDGGGFKVNWGGDRILQYHPESLSHHDGAYYKISSGKTGTIRIDLDGNIIK